MLAPNPGIVARCYSTERSNETGGPPGSQFPSDPKTDVMTAPNRAAARRLPAWAQDALALVGITGVFLGLAALFAWSWTLYSRAPASPLDRYAPIKHGDARLLARLDERGTPVAWTSESLRLIPRLAMFNELRFGPSGAIIDALSYDGRDVADALNAIRTSAAAVAVTRRELSLSGAITERTDYLVRDGRGLHLVGWEVAGGSQSVFFKPALLLLPSTLADGSAWQADAHLGPTAFQISGIAHAVDHPSTSGRELDDCLRVTIDLAQTAPRSSPRVTRTVQVFCASTGLIESRERTLPDGDEILWVLAADESHATRELLPPPMSARRASTSSSSGGISLDRMGQVRNQSTTGYTTVPTTWAPGTPDIILSADQNAEIVALDAAAPGAPWVWRFQTEGSIFGTPSVDYERGRIYLGTAAKRVLALDTRGLFRWAFSARDNVVATPLVADELVIIASEDRTIYAVEADTGQLRWSYDTAGPIVASPLRMGDTVLVASTDETLYGLDLQGGELRWALSLPAAAEAPLTLAEEGRALIPTRDGSLGLLHVPDCPRSCALRWSTRLDAPLRSDAVTVGSRAFVITEEGSLVALDLASGARLWAHSANYVGPPVLYPSALLEQAPIRQDRASPAGDERAIPPSQHDAHVVIAVTRDGRIYARDVNGVVVQEWTLASVRGPVDEPNEVVHGPTVADDAVWLTDRRSVIFRLGPALPAERPHELAVRWVERRSSLSGQSERFVNTPVGHGTDLALVDTTSRIQILDPDSGTLRPIATLPKDGPLSPIDPVIAGDTLLAVVGETLVATSLADGRHTWAQPGEGSTNRPPVADLDFVHWIHEASAAGGVVARALDARTGAERWTRRHGPAFSAGGAEAHGGVVYLSTPPMALDAASGQELWRSDLADLGLGGPALDPEHATLYVGLTAADGSGVVAALNARTGVPIWRTRLAHGPLSLHERLWLSGSTLIVPSFTGAITGLDARTGAQRWTYTAPGSRMGNVTVANGQVWLMLENAQVMVLDAPSGQLIARLSTVDVNVGSPRYRQRPYVSETRGVLASGHLLLGVDLP